MRPLWLLAFCGLALAWPVAAEESAKQRLFYRLYYDAAVIEYCGGEDETVIAGFRLEHQRLLSEFGVGPEEDRRLRLRAYTAADLEYLDRGLSGQKHWCATEGADALRHFRDAKITPP